VIFLKTNMLTAEKIVKKRDDRYVLQDVSISVERGTIVSLIGPSGAGKTTLLNVLSAVDSADDGEVKMDGTRVVSPSPHVAMVFQQLFLWPHLTLRENISLGNRSTNAELEELISALEMHTFIDRYPNQTSLGQRQRAAFARAVALKPEYLLLDEITSALDIEQIERVAMLLEKLKQAGTGILAVSHLINFSKRISDQIVFMDAGVVIETGGKELISNPQHLRTQEFLKFF
jgi:ABC-type polar amino acid transport system ATPase subunit